MYSIHKKLNLTIVTSMMLVLSVTAVFLYLLIARQVESVFDNSLVDKTNALISLTEMDEEGLEFDFTEGMMPEFEIGDGAQYYQLWENGNELLVKSPSLQQQNLPRLGVAFGEYLFSDLILENGRNGRLVETLFLPRTEYDFDEPELEETKKNENDNQVELPTPQPITIVFARERETLNQTLLTIAITIFGVIVLVVSLSALIVRHLVRSGLSPLSNLARRVGKIDESRLDQRIAHSGEQSLEIAPIEDQLNHLLERLQSAFEREKRFSSNVAHELRTPLSELRTLAEVGRIVPESREQITEFFGDVADISAQMEKVVITLLELARSDAGLLRVDPEEIELGEFCDEIWKHSISDQGQDRTLIKNIPEGLTINTDREKLGMILSNLFNNAINYSPSDEAINIDARIQNNNVVIEVRNAAIDLKPEDIVHMRDRFWRKQGRQEASNGHSGLGLSLVDAFAKILSLNVKIQLDQKIFLISISGLTASLSK